MYNRFNPGMLTGAPELQLALFFGQAQLRTVNLGFQQTSLCVDLLFPSPDRACFALFTLTFPFSVVFFGFRGICLSRFRRLRSRIRVSQGLDVGIKQLFAQ